MFKYDFICIQIVVVFIATFVAIKLSDLNPMTEVIFKESWVVVKTTIRPLFLVFLILGYPVVRLYCPFKYELSRHRVVVLNQRDDFISY